MATIDAFTTPGAILGAVLVKLRTEKGIKQGDLAGLVGISASTWSRIEKGESGLSIEQLRAVAKALGVAPGTILELAAAAEKEVEDHGVRIASHGSAYASGAAAAGAAAGAAAAGAVAGAAIGTVVPIFGTALGAIIGGTIMHFLGKAATDKKE